MKKNLLLLGVMLVSMLNAQNLNWNWAMNSGDINSAMATHTSGNVYVAGQFNFSTTIGTTTLNSNLGFDTDVYIAKLNSSGSTVWAHSVGSSNMVGDRYVHGMAVDNAGNAFIAGVFSANMIYGTTTLTGTGTQNMFVAKYDNNGSFQWARRVNGFCQTRDVAVDTQGNVIVTGFFTGTVTAETHTLTATTGIGSPADIFIMKYDPSGNLIWSQRAGNSGSDMAFEVETDASNNIYIAGYINSGAATFGTLTVNTGSTVLSQRAFYAKYNSNGDAICVKSIGSNTLAYNPMECYKMALSGTSDVILLGSFSGTFAVGSSSLTSNGLGEAFVCKLANDNTSSHNSFDWIKTYGGTNSDVGDLTSNILVKNNSIFIGSSMYNNLTVGTTTLSGDAEDAIVIKMDLTGNFNWVEKFGGASSDAVMSMADGGTDIYVAGRISNTTLGTFSLVQKGFIGRFSEGGPTGFSQNISNNLQLSIYPNPSLGSITVRSSADHKIMLLDMHGRVLEEYSVSEGITTLSIMQPAGVYFLKNKTNGNTHKLIIQNP